MNNDEKVPFNCVFCGSKAKIIHFDRSMWYVQCTNPFCRKHDKYAYLGSTKNGAIEQWNFINRELNRNGTKKKKDDKSGNI
mgnify:CR=1 FL=1